MLLSVRATNERNQFMQERIESSCFALPVFSFTVKSPASRLGGTAYLEGYDRSSERKRLCIGKLPKDCMSATGYKSSDEKGLAL